MMRCAIRRTAIGGIVSLSLVASRWRGRDGPLEPSSGHALVLAGASQRGGAGHRQGQIAPNARMAPNVSAGGSLCRASDQAGQNHGHMYWVSERGAYPHGMGKSGLWRERDNRLANVGIAVLAVVVALLVTFALRPAESPSSAAQPINRATFAPTRTATPKISVVVARLQQAQAAGRQPVVSVIGSSLIASPNVPKFENQWVWQVIRSLKRATGAQITLKMHSYPGTTLAKIVQDGVIAKVRADKPDLVILEPSDPNNLNQNIGPSEATRLVAQVLAGLSEKPAPLVVGFVGSPLVIDKVNGETLASYVTADVLAFKNAKVSVCDVRPAMVKAAAGNLTSILPDGVHPNIAGSLAWATAATDCLVGGPQ
jgi:hypothetical protein